MYFHSIIASLIGCSLLSTISYACEGECIVGITNAFIGNYSSPVDQVFQSVAAAIANTLLPSRSLQTSITMLQPLIEQYKKDAYNRTETDIFPSYFHGKCQRNGVDPPGCPNPDCPVVCGTPGSLVHFYSTLAKIAFDSTSTALNKLLADSGSSYNRLETAVFKASGSKGSRVSSKLRKILKSGRGKLLGVCGGKEYPKCYWETRMKKYILSFP